MGFLQVRGIFAFSVGKNSKLEMKTLFGAFTVMGLGSIPGWETKILQAVWYSQKKKKKGVLFKNKNTITKDYGVFIHSTDT